MLYEVGFRFRENHTKILMSKVRVAPEGSEQCLTVALIGSPVRHGRTLRAGASRPHALAAEDAVAEEDVADRRRRDGIRGEVEGEREARGAQVAPQVRVDHAAVGADEDVRDVVQAV